MIENRPEVQLPETNSAPPAPRGGSRRATIAVALAGMFLASTVLMFAVTGVPFAASSAAAPHAAASLGSAPPAWTSVAPPTTTSAVPSMTPVATPAASLGTTVPIDLSQLHSSPTGPLTNAPASAGGTVPSRSTGASNAPTPLAPVSDGASTSQNWFVNNWSSESQVIQVGASNQSLAETGQSIVGFTNGTWFFAHHGYTYVSTSSNGGQTWQTTWPGQSSAWTSNPSTNPSYGDVNDGDSALAADSAGDLFLVSSYAQTCWADGLGLYELETGGNVAAACNSTANISAPEGFSFSEMPAGGGWSLPSVIDTFSPLTYVSLDFDANCGAQTEIPFGNFTYGTPQIFASSSGLDVSIVFQVLEFYDTKWTCSETNGAYSYSSGATITLGTYSISSTNGGSSWSAVTSISGNFTPFSTGAYNSLNGDEYEAFFDGDNTTVWTDQPQTDAQTSIAFTKSTDGGVTWSTPGDIDSAPIVNMDNVTASPFASISNMPWSNQAPAIAVDNWSSSPYSGYLYVVYGDNRTTIDPTTGNGDPGVKIVVSINGGTSWLTPINVTPDCMATPSDCYGASEQFFAPQVSVTPNGNVWVTMIGYNTGTSSTQQWVAVSTDAGATWTAPYPVSDTPDPVGQVVGFVYQDDPLFNIPQPTGATGFPWGNGGVFEEPSWDYSATGTASYQVIVDGAAPALNGAVATTEGLFSTWTDCRDASLCLTGEGNSSIFGAYVREISVNASGASGFGALSATVTVSDLGQSTVVNPTPLTNGTVALDIGSTVTVQAPVSQAYNSTFLLGFQEFSGGVVDTSSDPGTGVVTSTGSQIEAIFTPEPAGWINGTVSPTSANPKVYINSVAVTDLHVLGSSYWFNETELAGSSYTILATATDYNATSTECVVNDFSVCTAALTLSPEAGYLNDTILTTSGGVPQGLTMTLQSLGGQSYPFAVSPTSGRFTLEAPWGTYTLTASAPGLTGYSGTVNLPPGTGGTLPRLVLFGSHITGTLAPINAIVKVGGILLGPGNGNYTLTAYNWSGLAGTYKVTASDAGYSVFSQMVTVAAGQNFSGVNINLVNHGWFVGTVDPATATIKVGSGTFVAVVGGKFNQSLPTGVYPVVVEAAGFYPNDTTLNVTPGNASGFIFLLKQMPNTIPNCTVNNSCGNGSGSKNVSSAPGLNLAYVAVGAIILIAVIALIAAMLMMRKGRQGGDGDQGSSSDGGSTESMPVNDEGAGST